MTCDDYNLALSLNSRDPKAEERKFKEVLLLKQINENSLSVRKTLNGQFKGPSWQVDYCPKDSQRTAEEKEEIKAAAARKAEEERFYKTDHPRDGVYARHGAGFEERCSKFGDVAIYLAKKSISYGTDKCSISRLYDDPPDAVRISVVCNETPGPDFVVSSDGRSATVRRPNEEKMMTRVEPRS